MSNDERVALIEAARKAAQNAYCPYSKFRVGAAVLADGDIIAGCNVENASYGLTLCAERNALASAVAGGVKKIRGIALACIDADPGSRLAQLAPCGACRQWIQELAPEAEILILGIDTPFSIRDFLPNAFSLKPR